MRSWLTRRMIMRFQRETVAFLENFCTDTPQLLFARGSWPPWRQVVLLLLQLPFRLLTKPAIVSFLSFKHNQRHLLQNGLPG